MERLLPRTPRTPQSPDAIPLYKHHSHPRSSFVPSTSRARIPNSPIFNITSPTDSSMGAHRGSSVRFEDFLPLMARKLGVEGPMQELCKGFQLLMDPRTCKITFQSLKMNAIRLGLGELRDDELSEMMREGDLDGSWIRWSSAFSWSD
jgi:calcium-binding protein KIC and related proteins